MAQVRCIFGSTSGNTELAIDKIADLLQKAGHQVIVQRVENSKVEDLKGNDLCLLAAPTYGHGLIQEHFAPFLTEMKTQDLSGHKYAVVAVGDVKYEREYHLESAKILEDAVKDYVQNYLQKDGHLTGI